MINKCGKGAVNQISTVAGPVYNVALSEGPLKRDFLTFISRRFLESVILKVYKVWGSSSFWKCSKFKLVFKNAEKTWEKVFVSWIFASELLALDLESERQENKFYWYAERCYM